MNFIDAFERAVRCHSSKTALVTEDGRSLTYAELDERTDRLAGALDEIAPGARVATIALNGIPAIETMIASQKRGIGNVQLPFRASPQGLVDMLEPTGAAVLVFDEANADTATEVLDRRGFDAAVHAGDDDLEGVRDYETLVAEGDPDPPVGDGGNEHGILYTSGTTSAAKAVPFDQEQLWLGSTQVIMEMGIESTDRALVTTPWYHMVTTDAWILPHLQAGATLVVQSSFDPESSLRLVEQHDVTGLLAVPTQLHGLVDAQKRGEYDVSQLSYIRTGGSVVTEQLSERVAEHLTDGLYNTYGLTEGGPNLTFAHPTTQRENPGTIGKESFTWELRVVESTAPDVDPDPDATVDAGETGEILAKGPGMCDGYLDRPEATDRLFVDGWLRTGDVAEVDGEGNLYVVDRVDNMIISGGENIYPQEVESVLATHEAVEEAAVLGLDDERWGSRVAAVVTVDGDVTAEALDEFCRDHDGLADFKRPREYELTERSLLRTDTGTLRRAEIREEFFG